MTNELIAALEAAGGPSRELDARIGVLQGFRVVDEGHPIGLVCYSSNARMCVLPRYTASIDAAMTLVPPRANTNINIGPSGVHAVKVVFPGGDAVGIGPTPAIALCIAALRAGEA